MVTFKDRILSPIAERFEHIRDFTKTMRGRAVATDRGEAVNGLL